MTVVNALFFKSSIFAITRCNTRGSHGQCRIKCVMSGISAFVWWNNITINLMCYICRPLLLPIISRSRCNVRGRHRQHHINGWLCLWSHFYSILIYQKQMIILFIFSELVNAWICVKIKCMDKAPSDPIFKKLAHGSLLTPYGMIFSCDQAALRTVRPSVRLSVCYTLFTMFPSWKFSGVMTNDRWDVHAKGQGQRSKVKITEVMTPLSRFRTVTPVWIHIWRWNDSQSLMLLRRDALLFF